MSTRREPGCPGGQQWEDRLALMAGGDLDDAQAAPVRAHVAGCAACAATLSELREALAWAKEEDESPFDAADVASLHARVMGTVATRPPPARPLWTRLVAWLPSGRLAIASAAAVGAILVAMVVTQDRRRAPETAVAVPVVEEAPSPAVPDALAALDPAAVDEDPWAAVEEGAPPSSHPLKIELRTRDPKIRIIWLAHR